MNFTVNPPSSIDCSLVAQANITIVESMTLPDLVYGSHNLTISATALIGDTEVSEIINFNIAQKTEPKTGPTPQPESFQTTRIAAAMVIVVIVGVGLLICLIKTKKCYR